MVTGISNGQEEESSIDVPVVQFEKTGIKLNEPLELPVFSMGVKNALTEGKSAEVWSQMIDELLMFYCRKYPDRLKSLDEYQLVGRMMLSAYPTISRFGTHLWVCVRI